MASSPRPPSAPSKTELETVIQWPVIAAAGTLALLVLTGFLGLVLLCGPTVGTNSSATRRTTVRPRKMAPAVEEDVPVALVHEKVLPTARPAPTMQKTVPPTVTRAPAREERAPVRVEPPPRPQPLLPAPQTRIVAERPQPPKAPAFSRPRHQLNEYQLVYLLREVPELNLDAVPKSAAKVLEAARKVHTPDRKAPSGIDSDAPRPLPETQPILELLAKRPDLAGLPVRKGADCRTSARSAKLRTEISLGFRRTKAMFTSIGLDPGGMRPGMAPSRGSHSDVLRQEAEFAKMLGKEKRWLKEEAVSTLAQMIQVEPEWLRSKLVEMLSAIKGRSASVALARLAVFDLATDVRKAAVRALRSRPHKEYRPVLLEALRFPWAPVAYHAADALAALKDRDAVRDLAGLLDRPDPQAPFQDERKQWVVSELVRVNHLRNCLLCHAPSFERTDLIRGLVPEPGKPLPVEYYSRSRGTFVRADVTYLRQDFSVMQPVKTPDKWPTMQRYDYLVRLRKLKPREIPVRPVAAASYPQREAVLYALRSLTGEDAGLSARDWYRLLAGRKDKGKP